MSEKLSLHIKSINTKMRSENRKRLDSAEVKLINLVYHKHQALMESQDWTKN